MNKISKKVIIACAALVVGGNAAWASLASNLGVDTSDPNNYYSDSTVGLLLTSTLSTATSFVSAFQSELQSAGTVSTFESQLNSTFSASLSPTNYQQLGVSGNGNGTAGTVWQAFISLDSIHNTMTSQYGTFSPTTGGTGPMSVPGPVAGSGIFGLLAALGFVGFAWRKRAAAGSLGL